MLANIPSRVRQKRSATASAAPASPGPSGQYGDSNTGAGACVAWPHQLHEPVPHRRVEDLVGTEIERVNANFARVGTIKKFRLIDQLLNPEDNELTPTQKLKRKVVN